jgi:iron complex transport system substrate-binding protein
MKRSLAAIFALALMATACGDDTGDSAATSATSAAPETPAESTVPGSTAPGSTAPSDAETTDADTPARVVSLSPSATEMMFAIGAGELLVAVDEYSNYPPEAAELPNELSGFEPNAEAIAALDPDLVLHDGTTDLGEQLDELGIAHWAGTAPTTFDDIYTQIEQLGAATGNIAEAAELVAQMTTDIEAAVASFVPPEEPLTYFHELDNTLYSVTSQTFIGEVYALFGLVNIADAAGADSPYPQLSAEYVITANPDLVFLADANFGESADTLAARPGWTAIDAVANGNIFALDPDIPSRWGPRVVDFVSLVSDSLAKVPTG